MAHLWQSDSNLPYRVMIDSLGKERNRKNNSHRIMISLDNHYRETVPISIDKENPKILIDKEIKDFDKVSDWIKNHYEILINHWNQEINDKTLKSLLKKVDN